MRKSKSIKANYWISYSDLMAGLLFVFLSIIVISNHQYQTKAEALKEKSSRIDEAAALRKKIAAQLETKFRENNISGAEVDSKTGDIVFQISEIGWFPGESAKLLPRAKKILSEVIPTYLSVILDEKITSSKLKRILIEGHASREIDSRYVADLDLSQRRALSVAKYVLSENPTYKTSLRKHLVSLGRSFADAKHASRKIINGVEQWNSQRSEDRRVVIRYTLDYERILGQLANKG